MARKGYTAEQIIKHFRQVELTVSPGRTVRDAIRQIAVSEQAY